MTEQGTIERESLTRSRAGLRLDERSGEVACKHRDLSVCPTCKARLAGVIIRDHGGESYVEDVVGRDMLVPVVHVDTSVGDVVVPVRVYGEALYFTDSAHPGVDFEAHWTPNNEGEATLTWLARVVTVGPNRTVAVADVYVEVGPGNPRPVDPGRVAAVKARIDASVKAWEDGRAASPSVADYARDAERALGLDHEYPEDEVNALYDLDSHGVTTERLAEFLVARRFDATDDNGTRYKIVRFYRDNDDLNGTEIKTGLTLAEAQAHCGDPETSSSTATSDEAKARTDAYGPWFDGYDEVTA